MRTVQDILYSVTGQSLYFDVPEGRPSSVTRADVFIWDEGDDTTAEVAIGTPAVEANPATTLDGSAGPSQTNPRNVPLTATTGADEGRVYLITGATGLKEWAEVESVTAADSVTVKHPLHNDYASGATFQSTRITAAVDATWVADLSNMLDTSGPNPMYRVRWVYVVSGVTRVADTYFNLVRYVGTHGLRPQDVDALAPQWLDSLPTDHRADQGRSLIDDAYTAVKFDLHGVWTDDAMVANAELLDEVTRYKTLELGELAKILAGNGGDLARYQVAKDAYQQRLDSLLRITNKAPIRDTSGAAREKPVVSLTRR